MRRDGEPGGRQAPLDMASEEFRAAGRALVDRIADFLQTLPDRPVTPGLSPEEIRARLGGAGAPEEGTAAGPLLEEASKLLFENSVFPGHPRFLGYIVGAPSPIGALADLLAAAVNPNLGAWYLSPVATEIELQSVRWIAEMIGFPPDCGGLLSSGGNMANFVGFLAARQAKAGRDVRADGIGSGKPLCLYASSETHTWVQKAADLFGLGTEAIRWVETDGATADERGRAASTHPRGPGGRAASVPRRRHRRNGLDRRGGSARAHRRGLPRRGALVPRGRRVRRLRRPGTRRARGSRGARAGGLGRRRSPQVALRAARSRLHARARPRTAARRIRLPAAVLPVRRTRAGRHELQRVRPSEFARLPGAQSLAGSAAWRASAATGR